MLRSHQQQPGQGNSLGACRISVKFVAFVDHCQTTGKCQHRSDRSERNRCGRLADIAPTALDLARMATLMEEYADFPLGAADASVVALAERLDTDLIVTTDRRHFGVLRPRHCEAFRILRPGGVAVIFSMRLGDAGGQLSVAGFERGDVAHAQPVQAVSSLATHGKARLACDWPIC